MSKKAMELISKALREAEAALEEAAEIANEYEVEFNWTPPGSEAATYYYPEKWVSSSGCEWETSDYIDGYWESSAETC